jgi:hypothetical protein
MEVQDQVSEQKMSTKETQIKTQQTTSPSKRSPAKSQSVRQPADPVIYYTNGHEKSVLSKLELLEKICENPNGKHLLWTRGESAWRSWQQVPSLKKAVEAKLLQLSSKKTDVVHQQTTPVNQLKKELPTHTFKGINQNETQSLLNHLEKPERENSSTYLSVPETVFTNFKIELDPKAPLKAFVGLDNSLEKGGLFIPTERVLHVGDFIQVCLCIKGKTYLKFEAPIAWLRITEQVKLKRKSQNEQGNFEQGVAVYWPVLTPQQVNLLKQVTKAEEYEFYAA